MVHSILSEHTTLIISILLSLVFVNIVLAVKFVLQKSRCRVLEIRNHDLSAQVAKFKTECELFMSDKNKLQSAIQQKEDNLINFALNILQKNAFLDELRTEISEIKANVKDSENLQKLNKLSLAISQQIATDKDRKTFNLQLEEANKDFKERLLCLFPTLTIKEERLAAYLRLKLNSKEIASLLNINVKSVEMNRYRLRKKMKLAGEDNLVEFILRV